MLKNADAEHVYSVHLGLVLANSSILIFAAAGATGIIIYQNLDLMMGLVETLSDHQKSMNVCTKFVGSPRNTFLGHFIQKKEKQHKLVVVLEEK